MNVVNVDLDRYNSPLHMEDTISLFLSVKNGKARIVEMRKSKNTRYAPLLQRKYFYLWNVARADLVYKQKGNYLLIFAEMKDFSLIRVDFDNVNYISSGERMDGLTGNFLIYQHLPGVNLRYGFYGFSSPNFTPKGLMRLMTILGKKMEDNNEMSMVNDLGMELAKKYGRLR